MKTQSSRIIAAIVIIVMLCSLALVAIAQNNTVSYKLLDDETGTAAYTLNIVVPQTLLEYYSEKNQAIYSSRDFSKFVTPYAVKPIADSLWEIYDSEEGFANAALAIVHQMTYIETASGVYPVQTLLNAKGDCDIFSFVAASIINAGGLEVVLFHYEERKHMNIGVHLASPPENVRDGVYKFTYEDEPYYIAECTGGNWTTGWRVGECPENLRSAKAVIVNLSNAEEISPGQVSASFTKLETSDLRLEVSPPFAIENSVVTIRGSLTPNKSSENITIYLGISGQPWQVLGSTTTTRDGSFEYTWKSDAPGIYGIRASWTGDKTYAGSTSQTINAMILPLFLTMLVVVAIIAIVVGSIAMAASRHTGQPDWELAEPQPPTMHITKRLFYT